MTVALAAVTWISLALVVVALIAVHVAIGKQLCVAEGRPRGCDAGGVVRTAESSRAASLHCPRCGGGDILRSWLKMRERCPTCGLALERGEQSDFWIGAYVFNLCLGEVWRSAFRSPG